MQRLYLLNIVFQLLFENICQALGAQKASVKCHIFIINSNDAGARADKQVCLFNLPSHFQPIKKQQLKLILAQPEIINLFVTEQTPNAVQSAREAEEEQAALSCTMHMRDALVPGKASPLARLACALAAAFLSSAMVCDSGECCIGGADKHYYIWG